jgi:hypothetical protein
MTGSNDEDGGGRLLFPGTPLLNERNKIKILLRSYLKLVPDCATIPLDGNNRFWRAYGTVF